MPGALKSITTPALEIGYLEAGDETAPPVVLVHGFPDDARTWDRVTPILNDAGFRTLCPYVRGYGPTRFLNPETPRSAQYTALASDITAFADALELERFTLVGHDWGARASYCIAAMRPARLNALDRESRGLRHGTPPTTDVGRSGARVLVPVVLLHRNAAAMHLKKTPRVFAANSGVRMVSGLGFPGRGIRGHRAVLR